MSHRFSVWAPRRKSVAVNVRGSVLPMQGPDEHGWWSVDVPEVQHGDAYSFRVDGEEQDYPDPRSKWQPEGVHAASRVYDSNFEWRDQHFQPQPLASAAIYELHIGTFTPEGTLDAAIAHLDYLKSLGITHVELLPIASFEGVHGWGYDGTALYAPHEPYGGPDAVKRFVAACHERELAVLLDVVYNHFGPSGNYVGVFGTYMNERHITPWGSAVNFEERGSDEVRRFFIDSALMWMRDYHFDGLRLDAVHEFIDRSAVHFLEQLSTEVDDLSAALDKKLVLIAESDLNDPRIVTSRDANGYGMDAQWSDDFHHALHAAITGESSGYYADFGGLAPLAHALEHVFVYDGAHSKSRCRNHGRPAGALGYHHFLGYIQNHDQVGNRAQGDRLSQIVNFRRAQVAAAIVLTAPFVPMIFQGEEWAVSSPFQYFADHADEGLRRGVAEGRKKEFSAFGWAPESIPDPEDEATFQRSKLHWEEIAQEPHRAMLEWYSALLKLRHEAPELLVGTTGSVRVNFDEVARTMRIYRGNIQILVNLGEAETAFDLDGTHRVLIGNFDHGEGLVQTIHLATDSIAVLQREAV